MSEASIRYISAAMLRARYGGISDMTLWRWLADQALSFPKPLVINRRRFWRLDQLEAWEGAQLAKSKRPSESKAL
jgi:predicted DNA-binding transcriptional regulator AlpA